MLVTAVGIKFRILSGSPQHLYAPYLTVLSSDVESLKKGIIKSSTNKAKAPYTFLLVGGVGVGKSSVFELIANVFAGNDIGHYNFDILDDTNELGGSNNQSQTNSARLYELTSKNGVVVSLRLSERGGQA